MSDQADDRPDDSLPELTPEQEATMSRLLAQARHAEPIPAEVADRLDAALAGLAGTGLDAAPPAAAEAGSETADVPAAPTPVVDLAARRRRRNAGRLLAAAAAVIVAGVAAGQVIGSHDDSGSADSTAASDQAPERESDAAGSGGGSGEPGADQSRAGAAPAPQALAEVLPLRLTSAGLAQEVEAQLATLPHRLRDDLAADETGSGDAQTLEGFLDSPGFVCASTAPGAYGAGDLLPAYLDGRAVVLALRPAADGQQQAEVLECGSAAPLTSVTVPLP